MVEEQRAGGGSVDPESARGWERRLGGERRQAERRGMEVPVEKDRRIEWDRRKGGDRRES